MIIEKRKEPICFPGKVPFDQFRKDGIQKTFKVFENFEGLFRGKNGV